MENYALAKKKNPLTSTMGILFMVAGAIFLLPYLAVSLPVLFTFFISLFKVFANLFQFSGSGISLAFANLTPLLNSFVDLLQCFVGPVSLVLAFILIATHNEEKAAVFAVLNLVSTVVTLVAGKVSLATPVWAVNLLADLVLAFTLLAFSLCEGKVRTKQIWLLMAGVCCVIRFGALIAGMAGNTYLYPMEYYPLYDYDAFVLSYRDFVTAVLNKKSIASEASVSGYTFTSDAFADSWKQYLTATNAVDAAPISAMNHFDLPRSMAAGIRGAVESAPTVVNLAYAISACVMTLAGFVMMVPFSNKKK